VRPVGMGVWNNGHNQLGVQAEASGALHIRMGQPSRWRPTLAGLVGIVITINCRPGSRGSEAAPGPTGQDSIADAQISEDRPPCNRQASQGGRGHC